MNERPLETETVHRLLTAGWPDPALLMQRLREQSSARAVGAYSAAASPLLTVELIQGGFEKILVVVPSGTWMRRTDPHLRTWLAAAGLGGVPVVQLPEIPGTPWDNLPLHAHIQVGRAEALARLHSQGAAVVIAPASALRWGLLSREAADQWQIVLRQGSETDTEEIIARLLRMGYIRRQLVGEPGEFAVRGFVVDIYSPDRGFPVRMETFGDTIETLRTFNPSTQRSLGSIDSYTVMPVRSLPLTGEDEAALRARVVSDNTIEPAEREEFFQQLQRGEEAPWLWRLKPAARQMVPVLQALPRNSAVLVVEEERVRAALADQASQWRERSLERSTAAGAWVEAALREAPLSASDASVCYLAGLQFGAEQETGAPAEQEAYELRVQPPPPPESAMEPFARFLAEADTLEGQGRIALVLLEGEGRAERLAEQLVDRGLRAHHIRDLSQPPPDLLQAVKARRAGTVLIAHGDMEKGFLLPDAGFRLFTHRDIYGGSNERRTARRSSSSAFAIPIDELKVGEHIVHEDHGIGVFKGLKTVTRGDEVKDFIQLSYRDGDRLLIPVDNMARIQRYSSREGVRPRLDKLGGASWQKVKNRARRAIREMAGELVSLYAVRRTITGFAHEADNDLMREFEDSFPHVETPDQLTAIDEIKKDMESSRPMDRLLCGDVGFGKTELAIRAAFKAAISGTQTAFLAPTTILAQQHYETINQRLEGFPFSVDMISRFRSGAEQKKTLKKLKDGSTSIIVGTHRLLSRDVQFKNLGLLVIDEEQRFGVGHKEKIKQMRKRVDVLSLTATPIPRTLNMSLAGIRDMSLIQTPPRNRLAIQTRVMPFSEDVIRSAVNMELSREGQVFYLRNRIDDIEEVSAMIRRLCPDARPAIAHARMRPATLEAIMETFIRGETNVLVSTTIIENGIDIPNANTLIVERADRFGLAQLYQIRGRVGRSERSAYAYLLAPPPDSLTTDARRRLQAIREFSELGSGFRIAAMDLEIRGAGNLLGGEQSGHIEAIGFELYNRMLERTVREMRGQSAEEQGTEVQFNLGMDLHIPESYIPDSGARMKYYRQITEAESEASLEDIREELADLYGHLPESVLCLLRFSALRLLAARMYVERIDRSEAGVAIRFSPDAEVDGQALAEMVSRENVRFSRSGVLFHPLNSSKPLAMIEEIYRLLRLLSG